MIIYQLFFLNLYLMYLPISSVTLSNFHSKMEFFLMTVKLLRLYQFIKVEIWVILKIIGPSPYSLFCKDLWRFNSQEASKLFRKNKTTIPEQYGFRSNISTLHGLLDIITTAYDNIQNKHYTGIVFLDLKKAFDTVFYKTLLRKLEHYGIRGPPLSLIDSFLERKQCVSI